MNDGGGWVPIHHEQAEDADDPVAEPSPATASKPRESKPKPADTTIPLALVMSVPPELIAALSSLAGTMERVATEVSAQGKAIQALAKAISSQHEA